MTTDPVTEFAERWFAHDGWPDHDLIARINLKPVAKQIRQVLAHVDAEEERIEREDTKRAAKLQRESDGEPKTDGR